jgi:hypothetical protein
MMSAFERAKRRYASGTGPYSPLEEEALGVVAGLEKAALDAVYAENESGGHARRVVADVARVLGVDIDEGPGHRWDEDHMRRVVRVADDIREERDDLQERVAQLTDERDEAKEQADLWRKLAERQDNTAPIRRELSDMTRERDLWRSRFEGAQHNAEYVRDQYTHPDEADELRAVIVSQAREIARLKGESE